MAAGSDVQQREAFVSQGSLDDFKGSVDEQDNSQLQDNDNDVAAVGSCGFGPCRPRWLQIFAKPICFMIVLNIYCFVEGTIVSGLESVVLTSLERRYKFSALQLGMLTSTFDFTVLVTVIFISYFGGNSHKPRWLGAGVFIQGLGSLLFASPQFIAGEYDIGKDANLSFEACRESDVNDFSPDCDRTSDNVYFIFILANVLIGIGAAPLFTIGTSYIDDIMHPKRAPIWLGIFYALAVVGPSLGFGLGGGFLTLYVDPWRDTVLEETDPGWVGAWWIGFIICGGISILISVLFFMFPMKYPDTDHIRATRIKLLASTKHNKRITEEDLNYKVHLKALPRDIAKTLARLPFLFMTLAYSMQLFVLSGLVAFAPKYLETQFGLTASLGGLVFGAVAIPSAGLGIMLGALLVFFLKPTTKRLALYYVVINITSSIFTFIFFLRCPTYDIAGITVPYPNNTQTQILQLNASCNANCDCTSTIFEPVCGSNDINYFSPCRAGCDKDDSTSRTDPTFENCTCVTGDSTAESGYCDNNCVFLIPYLAATGVAIIISLSSQIPNVVVTLRCIADEHRSLGLGIQSVFFRTLGTIPGPIVLGALFDASCEFWQEQCGERGNCWVYHNEDLSLHIFGVVGSARVLSVISAICIYVFFDVTLCGHRKTEITTEDNGDMPMIESHKNKFEQ